MKPPQPMPADARPPIARWRYVLSCGLLLLPVAAWNAALARFLPPAFDAGVFWKEVPSLLALGENVSRVAVFALPFLMPLDLSQPRQKLGLGVFAAGTLLYFGAWLPLIFAPHSPWSISIVGFTAPAATPLVWLAGISLIGRKLYWVPFYRRWHYAVLSAAFVALHLSHAVLIYHRLGSVH